MCRVMETGYSPFLLSLPEKGEPNVISLGKPLVWKWLETKHKWTDDTEILHILSFLEPFPLCRNPFYFFFLP